MDRGALATGRRCDQPGLLFVGEPLRSGQLEPAPRRVEGGEQGPGDVLSPDRLVSGLAAAGDRQQRQQGEAPDPRDPGVVEVVDDRGGEDRRLEGELRTRSSARALERKKRVRWNRVAPSALKKKKRSTPACSAAARRRWVPSAVISSTLRGGWSRIAAARWMTVSTPRTAWRRPRGSPRSASESCTRTRWGPSRRGSRTRQRTSCPSSSSIGNTAEPTTPVPPVSRIIAANPTHDPKGPSSATGSVPTMSPSAAPASERPR